jgi:chromosome segregation ATPase
MFLQIKYKESKKMNTTKKFLNYTIPLLLLSILAGCQTTPQIITTPQKIEPQTATKPQQAAQRFTENENEKPTVVKSAMELSEKYANLSEQYLKLKEDNLKLSQKNKELTTQISQASLKLTQAQKELFEANQLLLEMRVELNNWKTSVLGFRDEIRQAETEQLKALVKILTILGGQNSDQQIVEQANIPEKSE